MEIETRNEVIRSIVNGLTALVDEAKFINNKNDLEVRAVDPAHVAMVECHINKKVFLRKKFSADLTEFGLDLDKVKEVSKALKIDQPLTMKIVDSRLIFETMKMTRKVALIDCAGMSDPKVPQLNLPAKIVLSREEIATATDLAKDVSDHVIIEARPGEGLEIRAEGDTDEMRYLLKQDDSDAVMEFECKEHNRSRFSLDYFETIVKSVPKHVSEITVHMGTDYPIELEADFDKEGDDRYIHFKFLLAPRTESE